MHRTGKGNEGTNIKGRQGRTRFDCSKSKKRRKLIVRDVIFCKLAGFWEEWRALSGLLKRGEHSSVSETQNVFFRKPVRRPEQETEEVNQSRMVISFIV